MAMNKKEREALEFAQKELAIARALRWSRHEPLTPDVPVPGSGHSVGWLARGDQVERAWSESVYHGYGEYSGNRQIRSGRQNGRRLYSTELLALKALRYERERYMAIELATFDRMILELEKP